MTVSHEEALFQGLLESAPDAIIILAADGLIEIVNAQTERLFGYARDEMVGQEVETLIPERYRSGHPHLRDGFRSHPTTRPMGAGLELFGRRKDGSEFPVEISLSPMDADEDRRVICVVRDVSLQKQTQERLHRNLDLLQAVMEGTTDRIFIKDVQGRYLLINSAGARFIGLKAPVILGKDDTQIYPPETARRLMEFDRQVMASDEAMTTEEEINLRNRRRTFLSTKAPLRDSAGGVVGLVGVSQDITERKSADKLVQESEEKFRLLVEGIRDYAVIMLDPTGCVASWNDAGERMTGYSADEALGRHCSLLYTREEIERGSAEIELRASESLGSHQIEGWRVRKDGSHFLASVVTVPLRDEVGGLRGYSQVIQDVTEKRLLEQEHERFVAASRAQDERERIAMELHDGVIQSLYGVSLTLEAMEEELREAGMDVFSRTLNRTTERLSDSIRDIRSFVMELRPAVTEPSQLPDELRALALALAEGQFTFEVIIAEDLPDLTPNQVQCIYRVTQEALNNARKHAHASRVDITLTPRSGRIHLEVVDDGVGFDSRIRRPDGQGLRNMIQRAEGLQGQLEIESSPGQGTRVLLVLKP